MQQNCRAIADMDVDMSEGCRKGRIRSNCCIDDIMSVPVPPDYCTSTRENPIDGGDVRGKHRGDEDISPDEILLVDPKQFWLGWELEEEWPDGWGPIRGCVRK